MDVHSFQLATGISFAVMACLLAFFRPSPALRPVLRLWLASRTLLATGYFLYALTDVLPRWLAVHTGNGIVLVGLFLEAATLYRYFQPERRLLALAVLAGGSVLAAALVAAGGLDNSVRLFMVSAIFAVPYVLIVAEYAGEWEEGSPLCRFLAVAVGAVILANLGRGALVLLSDPAQVVAYRDLSSRIFFVLLFLAAQIQGFGFLFLIKERSDEEAAGSVPGTREPKPDRGTAPG